MKALLDRAIAAGVGAGITYVSIKYGPQAGEVAAQIARSLGY